MPLSEADTRSKLIDPAIHARAWTEDLIRREETAGAIEIIKGKPHKHGKGRVDYTLRVKVNTETQPEQHGAVIEIATALPVLSEFGCETLWTAPVMFTRFNWRPPQTPSAITMPDSWAGVLQFAAGTHWSSARWDRRWHISSHGQAIRRDRSFYMAFAWPNEQPPIPPSVALFGAWGNSVRDSLPRYQESV